MRLIDADDLDYEVMQFFMTITGNPKQSTVVNECKRSFRNMIDEQPTVEATQKWVPCSERLPEKEEYVLLSLVNLDIVIGFRANAKDYWYYGGQYLTHNNVIAWMPLPEPYKIN